ncbi:hypothetical protein EJ04DRAFT_581094 [Polyplosphaeria fusca]|uniref:Zn(2)-C6 fungal-type domain-containing protein n=1 Tax=Polyplosphaeria fusca TaxID=682080 RepID=A0A9P4QK53_9PLEO|nr:hypothetical protein EJ04DRAFT_581094 [Polyplosphaeria fusca]
MNFVDVQPRSFLDYAWTTPSSAPASSAKTSKTSRKQNRCCDQCRKGKRACDAAILEDTLLDSNGASAGTPTVFHYSDVFGPLAACGNCEKTKKSCTFEWLRSQRVLQAAPQPSAVPPAKRRRKSSSSQSSQNRSETTQTRRQLHGEAAPQPTTLLESDPTTSFGLTFADFPGGIPAFDMTLPSALSVDSFAALCNDDYARPRSVEQLDQVFEEEDEVQRDRDSANGSSIETLSDRIYDSVGDSPTSQEAVSIAACGNATKENGVVTKTSRKRRRHSSSSLRINSTTASSLSFANGFLVSSNNAFLAEGLLKIYHDSFENALACWLTERTCPYSKDSEVSLANDAGPDWNRIYHRVFRLDRLASPIRGRNLTLAEEKAASRAINLAIFSFATQWAQSSNRSKARYPFHSEQGNNTYHVFSSSGSDTAAPDNTFDRELQVSAWHEARVALQDAAEIESFRVVLAQIVFSLTQKPTDDEKEDGKEASATPTKPTMENGVRSRSTTPGLDDRDTTECEDLLSKLSLAIDKDGPPIHLEQGLRLIHSLRSRMALSGRMNPNRSPKPAPHPNGNPPKRSSNKFDDADRATVDLLFWLGVMFDTLSSAMHKRPLVVSDEDSDIYSHHPRPTPSSPLPSANPESLWDTYLFARQRPRLSSPPTHYPCPTSTATSLLCDAAPVKVLLFRKVTRIQTLLARNVGGARIEHAVSAALAVHEHWGALYAPFIRDCVEHHDALPPQVQSWYICLTGHWHLATLLLADLIEIIDASGLSLPHLRSDRETSRFVSAFRLRNCRALSDLARCAVPRDEGSFQRSREFHFAVNQGALLTEPWTAVLIRAMAKAGVILLEHEDSSATTVGLGGEEEEDGGMDQEEAFRRADDCVKALWYLGRKSDMALSAARILGDALRTRRKGVEERVDDMSAFLEAELWEGFGEVGSAFGVECV